eukprot:199563-Amorphochlora_amoeboformis.AAC.1
MGELGRVAGRCPKCDIWNIHGYREHENKINQTENPYTLRKHSRISGGNRCIFSRRPPVFERERMGKAEWKALNEV